MTDERYPDVPEDADGIDAVLRTLSEIDEGHPEKAVGLVGLASREFEFAKQDGDLHEDTEFDQFVNETLDQLQDALERRDQGE